MEITNNHTANLNGENLVFIVGCPRSGTTWLQRLLATHPQVQTGQESRLFAYIGWQFRLWQADMASPTRVGRGGIGMACYLTQAEFLAIQKRYLADLLAPILKELRPGQIFLEKTPSHALYISEIAHLLPAAKIIHIVRDPRDVVASMLAAAKGWGQRWAPRQARKGVRVWREHVTAARTARTIFPPGQFLEIHYEDLFDDPDKCLATVVRFLNLSWSDAEIKQAVVANAAKEMRQGKGTPIPIRGELGKQPNSMVQEPQDFVRKAQPGSWRQDLSLLERLQVWFSLRGFKDEGQRPAKK